MRLMFVIMLAVFLNVGETLSQEAQRSSRLTIQLFEAEQKSVIEAPLTRVYAFRKGKGTLLFNGSLPSHSATFDVDNADSIVVSVPGYHNASITLPAKSDTLHLELFRKMYQTEEVSVTGSFMPENVRTSPYRVKVLNKQYLDDRAIFSLREVMQLQLNTRVTQDNILGSSMQLQGVGGEGVKILIDGVPVIGRLNGNIDLSQIYTANIDRIEIIEGPMAVQYGTDALGGVINLITKKGGTAKKIGGMAQMYGESVGIANIDAALEGTIDGLRWRGAFGRNFFGGFSPQPDTFRRWSQWKPREQYFGEAQIALPLGAMELRYDGRLFSEFILNRGEPRRPYGEIAFDDTYRTTRHAHSLFLEGNITPKMHLHTTLNYSEYSRRKNSFVKNLVTLEEAKTADPADQDTSTFTTYLFRGVFSHSVSSLLDYQVGTEVIFDEAGGRRIRQLRQEVDEKALFGVLTFRPTEYLTLRPGLRLTRNSRYGAPLIPSLHTSYSLGSWHFKGSYAKGFRAPSLRELEFFFVDINHNIQGNPELNAETSDNIQFSVQSLLSQGEVVIKPEIMLFHNDIRNLITLAFVSDDLYSYINIGRFRTQGINVGTEVMGELFAAKLSVGYIGRANTFAENVEASAFFYSPEILLNAQFSLPYDIRVAAFGKYTGRVPLVRVNAENNLQLGEISDFIMADITVSKRLLSANLELSAGVKNLLNVTNILATGGGGGAHSGGGAPLPMGWGRTAFLQMRYSF